MKLTKAQVRSFIIALTILACVVTAVVYFFAVRKSEREMSSWDDYDECGDA